MNERYWQNWDMPDIAASIDKYWNTNILEKLWRDLIISDLSAKFEDNSTIFEIGCGSGLIYHEMVEKGIVTPKSYQGADISEKMLEIAKANYPEATFSKLDILKLPFDDRSQPNVICVHVIQHLPSYEEAIEEMARVCKNELYIVGWFNCDYEDDIQFTELFLGGASFHNNFYSMQKFLYFLYSKFQSRIKNLTCTKIIGFAFAYSVTMTFDEVDSTDKDVISQKPVIYISPRKYQEETLNLQTQLNEGKEQLRQQMDQNTNLSEQLRQQMDQNTNLSEQLRQQMDQNTNLSEQLRQQMDQNTNLSEQLRQQMDQNTNLSEQLRQQIIVNSSLQSFIDELSRSKIYAAGLTIQKICSFLVPPNSWLDKVIRKPYEKTKNT